VLNTMKLFIVFNVTVDETLVVKVST